MLLAKALLGRSAVPQSDCRPSRPSATPGSSISRQFQIQQPTRHSAARCLTTSEYASQVASFLALLAWGNPVPEIGSPGNWLSLGAR